MCFGWISKLRVHKVLASDYNSVYNYCLHSAINLHCYATYHQEKRKGSCLSCSVHACSYTGEYNRSFVGIDWWRSRCRTNRKYLQRDTSTIFCTLHPWSMDSIHPSGDRLCARIRDYLCLSTTIHYRRLHSICKRCKWRVFRNVELVELHSLYPIHRIKLPWRLTAIFWGRSLEYDILLALSSHWNILVE